MVSFTVITRVYLDSLDNLEVINHLEFFLEYLFNSPWNVVVFTDKRTWDSFLANNVYKYNKPNLRVFSKEYDQFYTSSLHIDWDTQRIMDKKESILNQFSEYKKCIQMYKVTNETFKFMKEMCEKNPFNTDYLIWAETSLDILNHINPEVLFSDKSIFFTQEKFDQEEFELFLINHIPKIDYNSTQLNRITHELMIFPISQFDTVYEIYYRLVTKLPKYKRFIGNIDFNLNYLYLLYKDLFHLVPINQE